MKTLIKILLIGIMSYAAGYVLGSVVAKAQELPSDKIERIGIFSQTNGYQMIEVCRETGPCDHYKVKTEDMDKWEMPETFSGKEKMYEEK
jgi:hypothetical protein